MAFSFHANTLAFGGQLGDIGARKFLPSQASVTLPPEGGFGESSINDYKDGDVSFYRAESRVYGNSFDNRLFKTYANVTVYGLDVAGLVQADVLSASVTSINERVNGATSESRISFDASIVGLVIDGHPYDVDLDVKPFLQHGTLSEFTSAFTTMSEDEITRVAQAYNWPVEECQTKTAQGQKLFHVPARCNTGLRATVLHDIRPSLAGDTTQLRRQGFSLEVPGLGVVHLGEVLLTTGRRGINLLRVELGKTLDDLVVPAPEPVPVRDVPTEERRPRVVALADAQPAGLVGPTGGYTLAHATGNGTDFGPP
jgi:hypothetical protein